MCAGPVRTPGRRQLPGCGTARLVARPHVERELGLVGRGHTCAAGAAGRQRRGSGAPPEPGEGLPGGCRPLSWGSGFQDAGERANEEWFPRPAGQEACRPRSVGGSRGGAARAPQPGRAQRPSAPRPFSFWGFLWPPPPPPTSVFHPLVCIEALSRLGTERRPFPKIPTQGSNAERSPTIRNGTRMATVPTSTHRCPARPISAGRKRNTQKQQKGRKETVSI